MLTDIEIAQQGKLLPISEIAERLAIPDDALVPYGRTKGKISLDWIADQLPIQRDADRTHYLEGLRRAGLD